VNKLTIFLLVLIGLLQYRLWFGDGNILELHRLSDKIEELRRDGAKRRERNAALEAEVMDLKQGTEAIEERARQDLGMIKEGEVFVQVIDHHLNERDARQPAEQAPAKEEEKPVEDKPPRRRKHRAHPIRQEQTQPAGESEQPEQPSDEIEQ